VRERYATWAEAEIGMAPPDYTNLDMDGVLQRIRHGAGPAWRPDTEKLALSVFDMSDPHAIRCPPVAGQSPQDCASLVEVSGPATGIPVWSVRC
jgi:hypothetical protein